MRRRRERETPEFAAMVRRMIRAYGRRCADADPEDLAELVAIARSFDEAITEAVAGLRANGFSWGQIAGPLGITRQAAQQRYGAPVAELHHQKMLRDVETRRSTTGAYTIYVPKDAATGTFGFDPDKVRAVGRAYEAAAEALGAALRLSTGEAAAGD